MNNSMDNRTEDNGSSAYILDDSGNTDHHFGCIHSDAFSNIRQIDGNRPGPFSIYSATRFGKRYILKSLSPAYMTDPNFNIIQSKEFEIGISIDHPNIRSTIGIENVPSLGKSIILEYIDGQTLDNAIAAGAVTIDNAWLIAAQLADAISYIHNKQIVHGDIKPSNILITFSRTNVKLIDFSLSDNESFIILKNPGGTKRYTAPELNLPGASPSVKADIYSFGVVVSELARAVSDPQLLSIAKKYCSIDVDNRPSHISSEDFMEGSRKTGDDSPWNIGSRLVTHILLIAAGILVITIAILSYLRLYAPSESPKIERQPENTNIRVIDMQRFSTNN